METSESREAILVVAERMVAERGIDVPLREVAKAAEQHNNSAVQYHFGSRSGLLAAVLDRRFRTHEARRLDLLAESEASGRAGDLRSLVEILALPVLEMTEHPGGSAYARFYEAVRNHPTVLIEREQLDDERTPSVRIVVQRIESALDALDHDQCRQRLHAMSTTLFALAADRERAIDARHPDTAAPASATEVIDLLVGLLTAPVSQGPAASDDPTAPQGEQ